MIAISGRATGHTEPSADGSITGSGAPSAPRPIRDWKEQTRRLYFSWMSHSTGASEATEVTEEDEAALEHLRAYSAPYRELAGGCDLDLPAWDSPRSVA